MATNPNQNKNLLPKSPQRNSYQLWLLIISAVVVLGLMYLSRSTAVKTDIGNFERMVRAGEVKEIIIVKNENVVEVVLTPEALQKEKYAQVLQKQNPLGLVNPQSPQYAFRVITAENFQDKFEKLLAETKTEIPYKIEERTDLSGILATWGFLILLVVGFWFLMRRMTGGAGGGQLFNIGKARVSVFDAESKVKITFADVAGLDEAKEEIEEIVDFLKNPSRYTELGGKIPKGVLLVGPPGTGKTLLAKAVAGESGVPFFSLSGSDFVEMFVGVGAARVRDLFKQAKEKAPCIIFIDEIDAIGRSRGGSRMPGSNDERENTLNSLLVEMDGFSTDAGVIIMAATNRPDVLDNALLRPGRFDRHISVDKPDIKGREAIFKVHLEPLKKSPDLDVKKLAAQTPGFAGAEIANVCNEAALIAARKGKKAVELEDFESAIDRVIGGLEKKNKIISPEEKEIVAYHEAGHAVVGWFLEHTDPLVKVSIVPRGVAALGYAQYLPNERYLYRTEQFIDEMCALLGGRVAEEVVFGKISTGALSDLERITKMAYSMVTVYGMNQAIGNISFYDSQQSEYSMTKPYSENTAEIIDQEVKNLVSQAHERTHKLLVEKRKELDIIAQELLKKEVIFQTDLERLIGARPFKNPTNYQRYANGTAQEWQVAEASPNIGATDAPTEGEAI
ncbi:ATP-dependent zinc metalloprotease FtsH [Hugenholtzia roseola]|uniref:ATP-dependent zinc metalloprotease FtsH n=1 Tax=Hugenholtzia roseola TaxID=1002 RepID=UPI0003F9B965|nr:ATP-dependent zinc metalloprotease FtsH [Hugenholtzia roseola]